MTKSLGRLIGSSASPSSAPESAGRPNLLGALREDERQALERVAQLHLLRRGHTLYVSADLKGAVCILRSGRLKLARLSRDGREFILEIVEPGALFGHLSTSEDPVPETIAEAFEDSLVLAVSRAEFEAFLRSRPDLALMVVKSIDLRLRSTESRMEDLVFRDIPGRLANALLRLADTYGIATDGGVSVGFRITQQELANLIGASREMVNHTLSGLRRKGVVALKGRTIIIRQREALEGLREAGHRPHA